MKLASLFLKKKLSDQSKFLYYIRNGASFYDDVKEKHQPLPCVDNALCTKIYKGGASVLMDSIPFFFFKRDHHIEHLLSHIIHYHCLAFLLANASEQKRGKKTFTEASFIRQMTSKLYRNLHYNKRQLVDHL